MWITSKEYRKKYGITSQHLYALQKANKINVRKLFDRTLLIEDNNSEDKSVAVYARVSTTKQKQDLNNQIKFLKQYSISKGMNPIYVFSDIASGMNENRKGLNELIDRIIEGKISKVIISHKDRLSRFGYGYLENLFNRFGAEIETVNLEDDKEKSFQDELTEDLIFIIHHFSMKLYGNRRNKCKEIEIILEKNNND